MPDLRCCAPADRDIGAGVEWVFQNRDDVAVADRNPVERHHPLAVGRPGEMHAVVGHRDQHLACTADLAETREYQADGLLQANVCLLYTSDAADE